MSNTLFFGWNRPVAGREKQAMELFQSSLAYWGKKKEAGQIESFEPVLLTNHGGDMNGFFLVRGEAEKLDAIAHEKEFITLVMNLALAVEGFGTIRGYAGDSVMNLMQEWGNLIQQY
jgi:hypothetical protein